MNFAIKTESLTKKIKGKSILAKVALQIPCSSVFGIIGKSGAGKSSLLKCLSSLDMPSSGLLEIMGLSIDFQKKEPLRALRKKLGMIFQSFELLSSKTAAENIALPLVMEGAAKDFIKKRVDELLKIVGLQKEKDLYPSHLSGGQKQRVAIARALAKNPSILFCDEATSALDPKTTQEILQLLLQLNKTLGLTLVIVSHEMEVIRKICSHIAVIDAGEIVEEGRALEVLSSPKHPATKDLLKNSSHEVDLSSIEEDEEQLLLSLHFKGASAKRPVLSKMLKELSVEVNILAGWIDQVEETPLGSLTIAIRGEHEKALIFLEKNDVLYEVLS